MAVESKTRELLADIFIQSLNEESILDYYQFHIFLEADPAQFGSLFCIQFGSVCQIEVSVLLKLIG